MTSKSMQGAARHGLRPTTHSSPSAATRRGLTAAAAIALPLASNTTHPSHSSAPPYHILDIFDAPARLGESSKLLKLHAATAVPPSNRSLTTHALRPRSAVRTLPDPILYDGPARPRGVGHGVRMFRAQARAARSSAPSVPEYVRMPPPELFDGPSRLRPYCHGAETSVRTPLARDESAVSGRS